MQNSIKFTPAHARIGVDRIFIKSPQLDPNKDNEVDETENKYNPETKIDPILLEDLLTKNSTNFNKYRNEGCQCIYNEKTFDFPQNLINFENLKDILYDENTEIILEKYKGKWIESINQMIPIENLQNFSENLYKFNPLLPLNVQFESRFESGNLKMAIKVDNYEYDLIVNTDINSGRTSNWFYFRVTLRNTGRIKFTEFPINFKFNIINCQKLDTLFNKGLKVLCFSNHMKKWTRRTKNNYYFVNGMTIEEKKLYTLTFGYDIDYNFNEETLYFSYCFPYTYTNLQNYLSVILNNPIYSQRNILRHEIIGKSLSENNLDMLIITKFDSNFEDIAYRPCIVLTSRVHPGESNSSYAIQGVIDLLLDLKNPISEKLRKSFIFKIIPMLNPDGVINGNFRTSLIGKDLNRLWDDPKENICPTIFYTKEMIKKTILSREVFIFCDFHGHSNKPNFFLYGCPTSRRLRNIGNLAFQEMILPRIFSGKNDMFDNKSCIYKIAMKKLKTARAVVRNDLSVDLSYCLESSIGCVSIGVNKFEFFTPKYYMKIGHDFCSSINDLCNKEIFTDLLQKIQLEEYNKNLLNNPNINLVNNLNSAVLNSGNVNYNLNSHVQNYLNQTLLNSENLYFTEEKKKEIRKDNNNNIKDKEKDSIILKEKYSTQQLILNQEIDNNIKEKDLKSKICENLNSVNKTQIHLKTSNEKDERIKNIKIKEKDKDKEKRDEKLKQKEIEIEKYELNKIENEEKLNKSNKKKLNPVKTKKLFINNSIDNQNINNNFLNNINHINHTQNNLTNNSNCVSVNTASLSNINYNTNIFTSTSNIINSIRLSNDNSCQSTGNNLKKQKKILNNNLKIDSTKNSIASKELNILNINESLENSKFKTLNNFGEHQDDYSYSLINNVVHGKIINNTNIYKNLLLPSTSNSSKESVFSENCLDNIVRNYSVKNKNLHIENILKNPYEDLGQENILNEKIQENVLENFNTRIVYENLNKNEIILKKLKEKDRIKNSIVLTKQLEDTESSKYFNHFLISNTNISTKNLENNKYNNSIRKNSSNISYLNKIYENNEVVISDFKSSTSLNNLQLNKSYEKIDIINNKSTNFISKTGNNNHNTNKIINLQYEPNEKKSKHKNNNSVINSKSIDCTKIYLTPAQKVYKNLNGKQIFLTKHFSKKKLENKKPI